MDVIDTRYQVGQRLHHPVFGEGLIVEVHTDRGREVLEVVFDGQLRRLSANREWEIVDGSAPAISSEAGDADGDDGVLPSARPPSAARRHWHPQDDSLLQHWLSNTAQQQSRFDLRAQAETWAGWASADRLVSLDTLPGGGRAPAPPRA